MIACALSVGLVACAAPETTLTPAAEGDTLTFVTEDYDLYPIREFSGEAWRLNRLTQQLKENGLCPSGYNVVERTTAEEPRTYKGNLYRVTYKLRCSA